ncbi:MAG: 5-formyltetrahydrofolate cyclo-ligase [Bacillota bacterium]|nr:5-formyltetrahydrofolate cyclo-ligase [Bacillota bacterium]
MPSNRLSVKRGEGMDKRSFRERVKKLRDGIPEASRRERSAKLCEALFDLPSFSSGLRGRNCMCFLSFGSEIDTAPIIQRLWREGARVFLPRVRSVAERRMDIVLYKETTKMERSKFGILEPVSEETICPEELDLVIVPALAFDAQNRRLGYGGGFYDSLLSQLREDCLSVGICFQEQVFEELPIEEHDLAVGRVLAV